MVGGVSPVVEIGWWSFACCRGCTSNSSCFFVITIVFGVPCNSGSATHSIPVQGLQHLHHNDAFIFIIYIRRHEQIIIQPTASKIMHNGPFSTHWALLLLRETRLCVLSTWYVLSWACERHHFVVTSWRIQSSGNGCGWRHAPSSSEHRSVLSVFGLQFASPWLYCCQWYLALFSMSVFWPWLWLFDRRLCKGCTIVTWAHHYDLILSVVWWFHWGVYLCARRRVRRGVQHLSTRASSPRLYHTQANGLYTTSLWSSNTFAACLCALILRANSYLSSINCATTLQIEVHPRE